MNYRILILLGILSLAALSSSNTLNTKSRIQTVVIDPGHGGKDNGCSGSTKANEKQVTLAIALKLGEKIKATYPNMKVVYTRDKDVFVELHKRADIANQHKADLFISIHCNAAVTQKDKAQGSETYALGLHRAEDNLEVMKRENDVILLEKDYESNYDYDPHSTENHIINALIQNKYLEQSINLATKIEREFVRSKRRSRGVKQAGFAVLRGAAMPAVLIESGFLTHNTEGQFLASVDGQNTMAESIFKAFKSYKEELENIDKDIVKVAAVPTISTEKGGANVKSEGVFVFKVQLAAVSNTENANLAALIEKNAVEIIEENGIKKIMSKRFNAYELAVADKQKWIDAGFIDAFIVVYKDGIRTTMAEYNASKIKK